MPFLFLYLYVLIKVSVAGASGMERISINGMNINFDEPGQIVSNVELTERIESMSEFVKVMVKGAETLSKNVSLAATRHLTDSEKLMMDLNTRNQALTAQVTEAYAMNQRLRAELDEKTATNLTQQDHVGELIAARTRLNAHVENLTTRGRQIEAQRDEDEREHSEKYRRITLNNQALAHSLEGIKMHAKRLPGEEQDEGFNALKGHIKEVAQDAINRLEGITAVTADPRNQSADSLPLAGPVSPMAAGSPPAASGSAGGNPVTWLAGRARRPPSKRLLG